MLPENILNSIRERTAGTEHPQELAVDVMYILQNHYGYMTDEALHEGADLLGMTPAELEELATFYDFIYREPVGKFVIHACDGVVCWMFGEESLVDYLCRKLSVRLGETTGDGLFTVLPTACMGFCDHAPAMLINGKPYGPLTPRKIDDILEKLKADHLSVVMDR